MLHKLNSNIQNGGNKFAQNDPSAYFESFTVAGNYKGQKKSAEEEVKYHPVSGSTKSGTITNHYTASITNLNDAGSTSS